MQGRQFSERVEQAATQGHGAQRDLLGQQERLGREVAGAAGASLKHHSETSMPSR